MRRVREPVPSAPPSGAPMKMAMEREESRKEKDAAL